MDFLEIINSSNQTFSRAHPTDAGIDIRANEDLMLSPGERALVSTGVRLKIAEGYVGLLCPRSSLGSKGLTLSNCVGVIDSGYRGECKVALWNSTNGSEFKIEKGDRIAQLLILPISLPTVVEVESLDETERGTGGFGSSGVK